MANKTYVCFSLHNIQKLKIIFIYTYTIYETNKLRIRQTRKIVFELYNKQKKNEEKS